jgi:hypothetical protein
VKSAPAMTPDQEDVMQRARNLLSEHFNAFIIIGQVGDPLEDKEQTVALLWGGGYHNALGMMEDAHADLCSVSDDNEEEDED